MSLPAPIGAADNTTLDDQTLMFAVIQRDQSALMSLYARYGGALYGLALRILGQPAAAEEVTQDIFLKVWNQPARWDPSLGKLSSWLLATTRNAAIDRLRQEQRHWKPIDIEAVGEETMGEPAPSDDPLWADGQIVRGLVNQLPDQQRLLVELAFFGGYTHSELADLLKLPLGTVKTRLRAALQALREAWLKTSPVPAPTPLPPARTIHG